MKPTKVAMYVVVGLLTLVLASIVLSAIFAAIAFVWLLARLIVFLLVVGILGYVGYKAYSTVSGILPSRNTSSVSPPSAESSQSADPVTTLKNRYARGELTEAEFERKLERLLDEREYDDIDRELQRERF